jgi:UDP-N-acetylglucosamine 3-dehydrogenase
MISVGLLGAGFMGSTHAAAYENLEGVALTAVADTSRRAADALAGAHRARAYYSVEALLDDDDVDVVDVCLPTHLHEPCVVGAVERGKHVLCEKPLALSLDEADRMKTAVERAGVKSMVAQVIRFWPEYVVIRGIVERGELGQPLVARAARLAEPPNWGGWFRDPELSGGALLDLHIHDLDYVYSLFGRPQTVYALGVRSRTGAWDHVLTSLDYGDKKAVVEASYLMPKGFPFQMSFRLSCEDGCLEYRFGVEGQVDRREQAQTALAIRRHGMTEFPATPQVDAYVAEIEYFMRCIEENRHPVMATIEEAREVLEIALAVRRSVETGEVIAL